MRENPRQTTILRLWLALLMGIATTVQAVSFRVAPVTADDQTNLQHFTFFSLDAALRKAREARRLHAVPTNEPVRIILSDGLYHPQKPLLIRSEDSGTASSPTIIEAAAGAKPVVSGGVEINSWKLAPKSIPGLPQVARRKVWVANLPQIGGQAIEFRQLWVNGQKAIRARNPNGEVMTRLTAWDKANRQATLPAWVLNHARHPRQMEMILQQIWETALLRLKSIHVAGTNAVVSFQEPESKIEFEHPWPPPVMTTNFHAAFFLANAIEFLDSPGEWYEDLAAGKVYYWPRPGEDMRQAEVVAPMLETLVRVEGSLDHPVAHLQFKGITFANTTWLRPSRMGNVPLQAGMYQLDAYKLKPPGTSYHRGLDNQAWIGRPPAAVTIKNANHISFVNCTFEHAAATGLDFESGTHDDQVEGCVFRDLGGNGLQMGKFSDPGIETHLPYVPSDKREICQHETIANNLVMDCGTEDWGSVGICAGYVRHLTIEHNELYDLPYTGISVGWGWTKSTNCMTDNLIQANNIHHVATRLGDTAGIYTLSVQPGTVIRENSVSDIQMSPYVSDPEHWFYLYLDEGSTGITVRDNWCPAERFLKNANGPGNIWTNNGPQVSNEIKNRAGLEPSFQNLLHEEKNHIE